MTGLPAGGACADPAVAARFDDPGDPEPALAACAGCPVLADCRTWVLSGVDLGDLIAGGMTAADRATAVVAAPPVVEWRTLRQQVADAATPAAGRRLLGAEVIRLRDEVGLTAPAIADRLGLAGGPDEARRLNNTTRMTGYRARTRQAAA